VIGSLLRPKYLTRARDVFAGFSSTLPGANLTTQDVQQQKLELVAEVANTVW
jgi:hypothetical protein